VKVPKKDMNSSSQFRASEAWPSCSGHCADYVNPAVLWQAYGMEEPPAGQQGHMGIAQFQGVSYLPSDNSRLGELCHLPFPTVVDSCEGPNYEGYCKNIVTNELCLESLLDVDYIKGIAGDIPLMVVSQDGYSLYDWADDVMDIKDRLGSAAPSVHSVSYGNDEVQQDSNMFMMACNDKFMQVGIMGMSVVFASGDMGVWGRTGVTPDNKFHPDFPASSPWITSVGGTNFVQQSVIGEEESWEASGGGFSDAFPRPDYQQTAVDGYFQEASTTNTPMPTDDQFNKHGRAYPDVAALGGVRNPYCVVASTGLGFKVIEGVGGTSASSPVWGGVIARLNAQRKANGLTNLGFLNPFIYQNPQAFNDVKLGDNSWGQGAGGGFAAVQGWDPATGMGTPNFQKLTEAALAGRQHPEPTLV